MVEIDYGLPSGTLDIWEGPPTMTVASPNSQSTTIEGLKAQISQWTVGNTNLCSVSIWTNQALYEVVAVNESKAEVQSTLESIIR